jgi:hypothetical protein
MVELAHGLVGRSDLPIPEWLFGWAAVLVLVVSFLALAVLWPEPKLQEDRARPLPRGISRVLLSRPVEVLCGAVGVFLLGLVVWSGLEGIQVTDANFAPTFVFVAFWLGLVPLSVVLGDLFRAFNPWRAVGRAVAFLAQTAARGPMPAPLEYPERLGYLPAAAGLFAFATLELVAAEGRTPENVAIATLVYSGVTFVAMALYGVETWCKRGEAFGVYFGLFARISPLCRSGDDIALRRPLSGLAQLEPAAGLVLLLAVMIGTVSFDGFAEAPAWTNVADDIADFFRSLGLSPERALEATFFVGLAGGVGVIFGLYRLGVEGARSVGGGFSGDRLARLFAHSLVPIALAYVAAHYLTLLLYRGQAIVFLASNPLGKEGVDLFGTANRAVDYGVIGATTTWYYQVAFVVIGHVAALTLAHDRALAIYEEPQQAVRSQYWMLAVMVGFTSLALFLLAQANA